jgi:hypothetical protein
MTAFPGSPRLVKGALISIDPDSGQESVIEFQYNPDTLTRRLDARSIGGEGGDKVEVYRLKGPPVETITLNIEIDATDKLEAADSLATRAGICPVLAALELLLYPKSGDIRENAARAKNGDIEIIPPEAPLLKFVWGTNRVVPVRITSLSITEEAYDVNLNPIHAKIDLSLQVLSTSDFKRDHHGYQMFHEHHIRKEVLAREYFTGKPTKTGATGQN